MRVSARYILFFILSSSPVYAGYVLNYHLDQYSHEGVKNGDCLEKDVIDAPNMRIETTCLASKEAPVQKTLRIFRGDKNLVWDIDSDTHRYTETTLADVKRKRTGLEDALNSAGGHRYKATGESRKVKKWPCTVYQHVFHDSVADEYCVSEGTAPLHGAGYAESLRRRLLETFDPFMINPDEQGQLADLAMGSTRFTLKHVNLLLDQPVFVLEFTEGHEAALPAWLFELPKNSVREMSPH